MMKQLICMLLFWSSHEHGASSNLRHCMEFVWQCFLGGGESHSGASVSFWEKLPPCCTEPKPDSSRTDPPLARAEPSSNGGRASEVVSAHHAQNEQFQRDGRNSWVSVCKHATQAARGGQACYRSFLIGVSAFCMTYVWLCVQWKNSQSLSLVYDLC